MSHTLTQPEEIEQVWKEMEQANQSFDPSEKETECAREARHGEPTPAYQAVINPLPVNASRRC